MRVALFTPFSPDSGGGAAQLRSHLRFLPDLDVTWYYLAPQPAARSQDNWEWLGQRFTAGEVLGDLGSRTGFLPGAKVRARNLVEQINADLYWIVGHYEGLCVAAELQEQGKPVHLTVHDDPVGTWIRSERYRWFRPLLWRIFPGILREAKGIDVTSWGMRNFYRQGYGVNCFSAYLHVPQLPRLCVAPARDKLTVGHIGTLYRPEPFRRFLGACKQIAANTGRALRVIHIGASPELDAFAKEDAGVFESCGYLDEDAAIPRLAACDLLYAMYPPGRKYERFRRTSLPIKFSTYVQAQRPIFAHTPPDSTLARIVGPYAVGQVCTSHSEQRVGNAIEEALALTVSGNRFEEVRNDLMGLEQLRQLRAALCGQDWTQFKETDFRP